MECKTQTTAVVLIPPAELWEPIQAIRRRHDRNVRRWMPHVTLIYPFRPRDQFEHLAEAFAPVCRAIEPFQMVLSELRCFEHGHGSHTLWLSPEPRAPLLELQSSLRRIVPDCDDVSAFEGGFTPHLSVGQAIGREAMMRLSTALQAAWSPLAFPVKEVSLIARGEPPDDVFRVVETIALGRQRRGLV
jgi:2'-5' RNA ligase